MAVGTADSNYRSSGSLHFEASLRFGLAKKLSLIVILVADYKNISFRQNNLSEIIPLLKQSSTSLVDSTMGMDFSVYLIEVT